MKKFELRKLIREVIKESLNEQNIEDIVNPPPHPIFGYNFFPSSGRCEAFETNAPKLYSYCSSFCGTLEGIPPQCTGPEIHMFLPYNFFDDKCCPKHPGTGGSVLRKKPIGKPIKRKR